MTDHRPSPAFLGLLCAVTALVAALVPASASEAAARPRVTGVAAATGPTGGGQFVTLHGSGFRGVYQVAFGGAHTRSVHVWSDTEMTVRAPRHGAGRTYVRVARRGIASSLSRAATYTYAAVPSALVMGRTAGAVPGDVSADSGDPRYQRLSCTSASFCAAVGITGSSTTTRASTFDGSSWSPSTALGDGTGLTAISCVSSSFCMALAGDGHAWRYDGTSWSDVGVETGMTSLDCGGPNLCAGVVGGKARVWNGATWSGDLALFGDGVAATSCPTATTCVATSVSSGSYRTSTGTTFGAARSMWTTSSLRRSSLTRHVTGYLSCSSVTSCVSEGRDDGGTSTRGGRIQRAVLDGSTWSIALPQSTRTTPILVEAGLQDVDCVTGTFCLQGEWSQDDVGLPSQDWTVLAGNGAGSTGSTRSGTHFLSDISCWSAYYCLGIGDGSSAYVGR